MLEREFRYFRSKEKEFQKQYLGKTLVIQGESVVGVYCSEADALKEASKKFKLGSFLIQTITGREEDYTQRFHSRAFIR
jgi:hypothetical protein